MTSWKARMRVLEISRVGLFKSLLPSDTQWIRWGSPLTADEPINPERLSTAVLAGTLRRLLRQDFDLLVLPATHIDHHHDQSHLKLRIKSIFGQASSAPMMVDFLNRILIRSSRHIILDINDSAKLCRATIQMFPNYHLYFKRELDLSAWTPSDSAIERVRPLSLFLPNERYDFIGITKEVDVFFAGNICSGARRQAVNEVLSLGAEGLKIHVPNERLSYRDYLQCMARSWIVVSPEGYGWDCYRHYEAGLVGSVALINSPNYPRHLFLRDGEHCVYYDAMRESVAEKIRPLLQDKARLERIGANARRHVLARHTRSAVARSMLDEIGEAKTSTAFAINTMCGRRPVGFK